MNRLEKTAILTLCLALPLAAASGAQETPAPTAKPKAVVVEATFDAGTVAKGEQIVHDFLIKNEGQAPLQIERVEPGCGCTVAEFDKVVGMGKTGKIHAVVDTVTFNGPISKGITVYTNDTDNPRIQLTVQAKIEPYIQVKPGYARYLTVQGEAKSGVIVQSLWAPDGSDFAVESVESPFPFLKAAFHAASETERLPDAKGKQWQIEMTLDNFSAPVGSLADYLTVRTTHPKQKLVQIPISGFVRPVVAVTPPSGDFGSVAVKDKVTKTLNVRNFATEDIKLTSIENPMSGKGLETAFDAVQVGREYMVRLTLLPDAPKGPFTARLVFNTDSQKVPKLEVLITGDVQ